VVVGEFNMPLSPIDRSSKQKNQLINSTTNHTIDQMDLADVYRIFHPAAAQYTSFSAVHGNFSKIDHILRHKASLSKYKKIEIVSCILSNHKALKLEINKKNNSKKHSDNWKLNNTMINGSLTKLKRKLKHSWKLMKMKTQPTGTYGTQ
jgi:hypothetical protein